MSKLEKSAVSLSITGKAVDPETLTTMLGCTPTQAAKAGDNIPIRDGKSRIAKTGFWHLEYGLIDAVELDKKISSLLAKLTQELAIWDEIAQTCKVELFCGIFVGAWNEGFRLPAALVEQIGERHMTLSFDVYAPVDSWYQKVRETASIDDHSQEANE